MNKGLKVNKTKTRLKNALTKNTSNATSGITLIALVVTIIILIILATITIKTLIHDGLIDRAIKGAQEYNTAEQKELDEMNKLSNDLDSILSGSGSKGDGEDEEEPVVIEGVITFGSLNWSSQKASVTINKETRDSLDIEYQVLDKNNAVIRNYQTIANGGTVSNLNLGDFVVARLTDGSNHGNSAIIEVIDETAPTINASTGTVTTNSIQVTGVGATDGQAGMPVSISYSYYLKESSAADYGAVKHTGAETSFTFTGLTQTTSYDIKVTATDIAGNTGIKEIKGITTGTVPNGSEGEVQTGVITFGSLSWASQKASVTINKTTSDSLDIEYQVLDKNNAVIRNYQTIANGGTVSNLNLGDFVIARLTDGSNHGNSASIEVTDGISPSKPTLAITSGTSGNGGWYKSNVTVTITPGTDGQSGVNRTTYVVTGVGAKSETEGTSVSITTEGTSYVTAYTYDNAGHKTASSALTIKIDKTNPPTVTLTYSSKTDKTVVFSTSMSSTTDTSGIAKYIFEYRKSSESSWITASEENARPSTYTFSSLSIETSYDFRVRTMDGAGNKATGSMTSQTTNGWQFNADEDVGKIVNYIPKANQTYTTNSSMTGGSGSTTFTSGSSGNNGSYSRYLVAFRARRHVLLYHLNRCHFDQTLTNRRNSVIPVDKTLQT